jgi:hypothetical protein
MRDHSIDLLVRLFFLVFLGFGIGVGVVLGLETEYASVQYLLTGHIAIGLWFVTAGAFTLFLVVYLAGYRGFVPMARQFITDFTTVPAEP